MLIFARLSTRSIAKNKGNWRVCYGGWPTCQTFFHFNISYKFMCHNIYSVSMLILVNFVKMWFIFSTADLLIHYISCQKILLFFSLLYFVLISPIFYYRILFSNCKQILQILIGKKRVSIIQDISIYKIVLIFLSQKSDLIIVYFLK